MMPLVVSGFFYAASDSQRLAGKVAVITGGASGIGKATATEFIKNGAKVIIADIQDDLGHSVAAELGPDAAYTRCDVADEAQVAAAVGLAVKRHGHLDVFHNNAGIAGRLPGRRSPPPVKRSSGLLHQFSTAANSQRLAGKVAVITGAASGIGKASAKEFIGNGAKVILADVQDDLGRAVAAELGPGATYTRCDVTDEAQVAAAVDLAVARHGALDVFYSNAGVLGSIAPAPLASLDLAEFDRVMAVNARAAVAAAKHAARAMVPRRSGCVLFTGSVSGVVGGTGPTSYGVSKAAVLGVVRAVAGELARHGVRANAVSPCGVATPLSMVQVLEAYPGMSFEELKNAMAASMEQMEAGPLIDPEDVARAAVFLASDEAKYINGHNLVVDGGFTVGKLLKIPKE
uniref:Uncharacterized protein n=1 Tax=Oryza meridionalis TaxID=40149 RepID=A0A0E0EFP6_9ORYZ